jgi:hypothetical protein
LQYRSHTTRSLRAGLACLSAALFALLGVAGCANNSERDIIARDRRMQEDQVYAMQDYVRQYQDLVCRQRSENASLRRQLSEAYGESNQSEPEPMPSSRGIRPSTRRGPQFESPRTPLRQQPQQPDEPQIEPPEVPPLETTTWSDLNRQTLAPADEASHENESDPQVLATSYEEPVLEATHEPSPRDEVVADHGVGDETTPVTVAASAGVGSAGDVMLSGEVVANDSGGGPRLAIDVAPFDKSGRVEPFDGSASLLLLAPGNDGERRILGRWDFGPDYVRSVIDSTASEPTMRFLIEMPADVPVGEATQLWVRLNPSDGNKLVAHADVNLTKPSVFSSKAGKIWPSEETVVAASYEAPIAPPAPSTDVATPMTEGDWAVAAPGQPANLPEGFDTPAKGWRASSEPIPPVMANVVEESPKERFKKLREEIKASQKAEASPEIAEEAPAERPGWAPDRPGKSASRVATRPSWSAKR